MQVQPPSRGEVKNTADTTVVIEVSGQHHASGGGSGSTSSHWLNCDLVLNVRKVIAFTPSLVGLEL